MSNGVIKIKIKTENDGSEINSDFDAVNWQFEEQPMAPKNEWLWALAILGFGVVVFSVLLKNYLLIIIVFLTAFIIYISKNKAPELHEFKLDSEGFHINGKIYPYENFESFWIFGNKEIALKDKRRFMPLLIAPFGSNEKLAVKKILSDHLPEVEEEEPFLNLLRKIFF